MPRKFINTYVRLMMYFRIKITYVGFASPNMCGLTNLLEILMCTCSRGTGEKREHDSEHQKLENP